MSNFGKLLLKKCIGLFFNIKPGLLIFAFFYCSGISAQESINNEDSIHKYLIAFNFSKKATLYHENSLVVVKTIHGKRSRGHLRVLNDSQFIITHSRKSLNDTLSLTDLKKIKRVTIAGDVFGTILMVGALPLTYIGIDLYTPNSTSLFGNFFAVLLIGDGIGALMYGIIIKSGYRKTNKYMNVYALATTHGFKLTKKNAKAFALDRYPHLKNSRIRRY